MIAFLALESPLQNFLLAGSIGGVDGVAYPFTKAS